jgi:hypothetical protein
MALNPSDARVGIDFEAYSDECIIGLEFLRNSSYIKHALAVDNSGQTSWPSVIDIGPIIDLQSLVTFLKRSEKLRRKS